MNPLLAREIRLRFRDKRSFWLLLALTTALCLTAGLIYSDATQLDTANFSATGNMPSNFVLQRAHQTGRELFRFLAMGNVLAWLLIAPALTATGLAKERERGLLESLWLSPFTVRSQILGRLASTLSFLFVLQVAALPVYGIALLLGGVSPGEIGVAGLVIAVAACFGASLGLWCSARVYRSANALGSVFFLIALWSLAALLEANTLAFWRSWNPFAFAVAFSHPALTLYFLLWTENFARFTSTPYDAGDVLRSGLLMQASATALMLWGAARKASKPLPDQRWSEGHRFLNGWRTQLNTSRRERQERRERAKAREAVVGALLYELPVEKFVHFKDPLLSREVRARFRLRQSGLFVSSLRLGVLVAGGCFWLAIVFATFDKNSHDGAGEALLMGLLGFGILAVGVMASTSLVRERESGTWEGLRLSLMPPVTLVQSKWLSPVITFLYWSAPLWILLPLCLRWDGKKGVEWPWMLASVLVALASLGAVSAWGLWISRRAPHSAAATSWTLATLLLVLAGLPALDNMVDWSWRITSLVSAYSLGEGDTRYYRPYSLSYGNEEDEALTKMRSSDALLHAYNPFAAQGMLLDQASSDNASQYIPYKPDIRLWVGVFHLFECALLTFFLLRSVTKQVQKPDA